MDRITRNYYLHTSSDDLHNALRNALLFRSSDRSSILRQLHLAIRNGRFVVEATDETRFFQVDAGRSDWFMIGEESTWFDTSYISFGVIEPEDADWLRKALQEDDTRGREIVLDFSLEKGTRGELLIYVREIGRTISLGIWDIDTYPNVEELIGEQDPREVISNMFSPRILRSLGDVVDRNYSPASQAVTLHENRDNGFLTAVWSSDRKPWAWGIFAPLRKDAIKETT